VIERHLAVLRHETEALANAARQGLGATVPSCPAWDVRALVGHVGRGFRMAAELVRTHDDAGIPEGDADPPDDAVAWLHESLAELVEALTDDERSAYWARRMANEVAVHRWDAQGAHGTPEPIDADVAVDGVDELLPMLDPRRDGILLVTATDTGDTWSVTCVGGACDVTREPPDAPDAVLSATASDLLLALWGRDVPYEVTGDPGLIPR
jgi:uncharacterized protein (TIGR03083 family)